jgi:hypothetical protein
MFSYYSTLFFIKGFPLISIKEITSYKVSTLHSNHYKAKRKQVLEMAIIKRNKRQKQNRANKLLLSQHALVNPLSGPNSKRQENTSSSCIHPFNALSNNLPVLFFFILFTLPF